MAKKTNIPETSAEKMLIYIPIEKLYPHPKNPRKNLGDLSELADSIKVKGVMQNLTVVPGHKFTPEEYRAMNAEYDANPTEELRHIINSGKTDDGYTVLIGHRRLEASKIAGITELPCIVESMTEEEQLGTMLLENLLREDLTIYEQAQGFQMMLDLGDSIDAISEKTGFSKTTVRRRIKLNELNGDTFRNVSDRQFTFADIDRLSQIEDIEARNAVLAEIGTKNFENRFLDAINKQKIAKKKAAWAEIFKERGVIEIPYSECWGGKYTAPNGANYFDGEPDAAAIDKLLESGVQLYFAYGTYNATIYVRIEKVITEQDEIEEAERERKRAEEAARRKRLGEISERAFELRRNFIKDFSLTDCKKNVNKISEWANTREIASFACGSWFSGYSTIQGGREMFGWLFGVEDVTNSDFSEIKEFVESHPEKAMLFHTYALWCDHSDLDCSDYCGNYRANDKLKAIYDGLVKFGYAISDEEQAMLDGTLPEYTSTEDEDIIQEQNNDTVSDDDFDDELAEMMEDEE